MRNGVSGRPLPDAMFMSCLCEFAVELSNTIGQRCENKFVKKV